MAIGGRDADARASRLRRRITDLERKLNPLERVTRFFREDIWDDSRTAPRWQRHLYTRLRVLALAVWNFQAHGAATHAAALTYTSLLALVPFLAVAFSLFQVFGGIEGTQDRLQELIIRYLAPGMEETFKARLQEFTENIRHGAGANAVLATVLLFLTVIRTLAGLEETFNRITGAKRGRSWAQRVTVYWAAATLGPVLLGAGLAMTAAVTSSSFVASLDQYASVLKYFYQLAPVLLTCAAFAGVYLFLPNAKMKPNAALVGGLVAGISFEIAKRAFTAASKGLIQGYNQVYGGIATIFVFLIWIYISWMIVIIGLEIVVAVQSATTHRKEELATRVSHRMREMIALRLMAEISQRFHAGRPPPVLDKLTAALDLPDPLIADVLFVLEAHGLVREVEEADDQYAYLPARTLDKITVADIVNALRQEGESGLKVREDEGTRHLEALVERFEAASAKIYGSESMQSLVEQLAADGAGAQSGAVSGPVEAPPPREERVTLA